MANGNYFFVDMNYCRLSTISLWSLCGSADDPIGKEGLSHFFEHLFLSRTNLLPNKVEVLRQIDSSGLFFNAYTRKNYIYYYFIQRVQDQDLACDMLIQGLNEFKVYEEDIQREREVIIKEQKQYYDTPSAHLWNFADKGLWPNSPLSSPPLGNKTSIMSITLDDIYNHKEKIFSKDNIGFLAISSKKISKSHEVQFNSLSAKREDAPTEYDSTFLGQPSESLISEYRSSPLVYIAISFPLPHLKQSIHAKVVLDFIKNYLASGWSSKLIERLRSENNYVYWVYGGVEMFEMGGYLRISLSTEKKHVIDAIKIITEEIVKLQSNYINTDVLINHKTAMKAHLMKHHIQPENELWWYGWNIFTANRMLTIQDYFKSIDNLTEEEIRQIAIKYLDISNMHIATLGNFRESDFRL